MKRRLERPLLGPLLQRAREVVDTGSRARSDLAKTFAAVDRRRELAGLERRVRAKSRDTASSNPLVDPIHDLDVYEVIESLGEVIKKLKENVEEKRRLLEDLEGRAQWRGHQE
jgi:hypothetical protein